MIAVDPDALPPYGQSWQYVRGVAHRLSITADDACRLRHFMTDHRQLWRNTRIQLSKAILRKVVSSKPCARSDGIRFCNWLASLIGSGMTAPSKSEPRAT